MSLFQLGFSAAMTITALIANPAFGIQQAEKPLAPLSLAKWDERTAAHLLDRAAWFR